MEIDDIFVNLYKYMQRRKKVAVELNTGQRRVFTGIIAEINPDENFFLLYGLNLLHYKIKISSVEAIDPT